MVQICDVAGIAGPESMMLAATQPPVMSNLSRTWSCKLWWCQSAVTATGRHHGPVVQWLQPAAAKLNTGSHNMVNRINLAGLTSGSLLLASWKHIAMLMSLRVSTIWPPVKSKTPSFQLTPLALATCLQPFIGPPLDVVTSFQTPCI